MLVRPPGIKSRCQKKMMRLGSPNEDIMEVNFEMNRPFHCTEIYTSVRETGLITFAETVKKIF